MPTLDRSFTGSIPEVYDRLLVPLIFDPYAHDLAVKVAALAPKSVLEIAAGTGAVTRALAANLPADVTVVATDLNLPMLEHARKRLGGDRRFSWQQADAQCLPFETAEFDAVLCQFGAMFFPNRSAAYRNAKRVLKLEGHFLFNVWDEIVENDFADEVTKALESLFPDDPPRFLARTPHGYHDAQVIRADLRAAGFTDIVITPVDATSTASSAMEAATAYCQGTPLRTEILDRGGSLEDATQRAANAIAKRFGKGAVSGRIRALVVVAC
jgi:ubiquinone/menaquinone biosynthesis C-methylase UbiE